MKARDEPPPTLELTRQGLIDLLTEAGVPHPAGATKSVLLRLLTLHREDPYLQFLQSIEKAIAVRTLESLARIELGAQGGALVERVTTTRISKSGVATTTRPVPLQQPTPPIVVGAARPMMLDLVGRKADVWNCPSGLIPRLEQARERVMEAADGRPIRTTLQIPVAVGRTPEEAEAALEVGRVHMAWMGDIDEVGITGTIDEATEKVAAYAERGVGGIIGVLPGSQQRPEFIEAYGELAARF